MSTLKEMKMKKIQMSPLASGYKVFNLMKQDLYLLMRENNWLLSEYNPVLKWATEELEKRFPDEKTFYGETYKREYERTIKKATPFPKADLVKCFDSVDRSMAPISMNIYKDDNWDAVARFDPVEFKSGYSFHDTVKYFNDPTYKRKKIGPDIGGHYAQHEYEDNVGVLLYILIYLKNNPDEFVEFYKSYEDEEIVRNFYKISEENEEGMDANYHLSEVYKFARLLENITTGEEHKKIFELSSSKQSDYFYSLLKDDKERKKIYEKALKQYWYGAMYILKTAPITVPIMQKEIKRADCYRIGVLGCKKAFSSIARKEAAREIEWYKNYQEYIDDFVSTSKRKITKKDW